MSVSPAASACVPRKREVRPQYADTPILAYQWTSRKQWRP